MCPLVEVKSKSTACRTYMLARKSVRNVETMNVHAAVSGGHGHVVSIANVRTKSHRTRLTIGHFHLNVNLLTNGHDLCPMIRRQHDVLVRRDRKHYIHLTRHDVEHPILLAAKSEQECTGGGGTPTPSSTTAAAAASATWCSIVEIASSATLQPVAVNIASLLSS